MRFQALALVTPLVTACAIEEPPPLDETQQEINGDDTAAASQYMLDRAVKIPGCTATKISARFAITAAHCAPSVNDLVTFYSTGPGDDNAERAVIIDVTTRPGVNASACNGDIDACYDSSGNFADIALIELALPAAGMGGNERDLEGHQATLAWEYPGEDVYGKKVGAGGHDGGSNPNAILLQHPDYTDSDDEDGQFRTVDDHTDGGDSGGPFYYGSKVLGTLTGSAYVPFDHFNIYTSVPFHLSWILSTIRYEWRGLPPQSNTLYSGTSVDSFFGTERECQYACEKTSSCEAYNFNTAALPGTPNCFLHDGIDEVATVSGWRGALKHGARSGNANDVVGFVRSDNVNTVVHKASNGNIHVLSLSGGSWSVTAVNPSATVASKLTAYRRAEDVDAIVFRSSLGHIVQILRTSTGWNDEADLTALTGAEIASGNPTAYVRADGVSAVVYRGAQTGHIIELRRGSRGFIATDLTAAAGSSVVASGDPTVNARSDGYSAVVFRTASGTVYELYRTYGGNWNLGSPSALAGAPAAADRPFAYTKRDGTNAIVYRQDTGQIVRLQLTGGTWSWQHLSSNAIGQPVAYVRTDAVDAVMFRNTSGQLIQVTGATSNLTTQTGAPLSATNPSVYVRSDGYNSILFETTANHVGEIYYKRPGSWADGDISAVAGETP